MKSLLFFLDCWSVGVLVDGLEVSQSITHCPAEEAFAFGQAVVLAFTFLITVAPLCVLDRSCQGGLVGFDDLFIVNVHENGAVGEVLFGICSGLVDKAGDLLIGFGLGLDSFVEKFLSLF
jgi:hypothetical protein